MCMETEWNTWSLMDISPQRETLIGYCVPCVADGAVGWTSRMVASMVEPEGARTDAGVGGYNHQMLK